MTKEEWFTVKKGKQRSIPKPSKIKLESLLNNGYAVTMVQTKGNKSKITVYSPKTRHEAYIEHKKRYGNIPF